MSDCSRLLCRSVPQAEGLHLPTRRHRAVASGRSACIVDGNAGTNSQNSSRRGR